MEEEKTSGRHIYPAANGEHGNRERLPREPASPANSEAGNIKRQPPGFLELVYGVLFEPVVTFQRVVQQLPLGQTILIFTLVNVIVCVLNAFLAPHFIGYQETGRLAMLTKAMAPALAGAGLLFQYAKWFVYSALLHLLAELLGGRGRAVGVWVIAGLASLPAIFLAPVELLLFLCGVTGFILSLLTYLLGFVVLVWGAVLLVIGLRQEHGLSTGRAVTVVFLPVGAALIIGITVFIAFMTVAASFPTFLPVPGLSL